MKKFSTWFYIGAGISLVMVYIVWFFFREDTAYAERFGIFVGLWVPTLLIAGKIMEDRNK